MQLVAAGNPLRPFALQMRVQMNAHMFTNLTIGGGFKWCAKGRCARKSLGRKRLSPIPNFFPLPRRLVHGSQYVTRETKEGSGRAREVNASSSSVSVGIPHRRWRPQERLPYRLAAGRGHRASSHSSRRRGRVSRVATISRANPIVWTGSRAPNSSRGAGPRFVRLREWTGRAAMVRGGARRNGLKRPRVSSQTEARNRAPNQGHSQSESVQSGAFVLSSYATARAGAPGWILLQPLDIGERYHVEH